MAPTEVLATQHFETLNKWIPQLELNVDLLTGSTPKSRRKQILTDLVNGSTNISYSVGSGGAINQSGGSCDDTIQNGSSGGNTSFGGSTAYGGGGGSGSNYGTGSGGSGGGGDLPGASGGSATVTPAPFWGKYGQGGKGSYHSDTDFGDDGGCSVGHTAGESGAIIILELG